MTIAVLAKQEIVPFLPLTCQHGARDGAFFQRLFFFHPAYYVGAKKKC